MANKGIFVQDVGEPTDKRSDGSQITGFDGNPRKFWKLTLVGRSGPGGARKLEAVRNFWLEDRDTLDRDVMAQIAASEKPVDLSADEEPFQVVKVDIHPRPVLDADGEQRVNEKTGELIFQTEARLIVLPGETVKSALNATHANPSAYLASEPMPQAVGAEAASENEEQRPEEVLRALTSFRENGA